MIGWERVFRFESSKENISGAAVSQRSGFRHWVRLSVILVLPSLLMMTPVSGVGSELGKVLGIREQRQTVCPGFDIIHRQNRATFEIQRTFLIRGNRFESHFDKLYRIEAGQFCGENLFVLLRGNFGRFVARYCKGGGFEFVAGLPSAIEGPVWDFSIKQLENDRFRISVTYGCLQERSTGKGGCGKNQVEFLVQDGGIHCCEGFPVVSCPPQKLHPD